MKKAKTKSLITTKIINENDEPEVVTESGIPGLISFQDNDVQEELQDMEGFAEEMRDRQSQYNGNDF